MIFADAISRLKRAQSGIEAIVLDVAVKNEHVVVDAIVEDQMYEQGIDGFGQLIGGGNYSPTTIAIKQQKGQRTDHFTLRDTGDFHSSITAKITDGGLMVDGDTVKGETDLIEQHGPEILQMTEENQSDFIHNHVQPDVVLAVKQIICG